MDLKESALESYADGITRTCLGSAYNILLEALVLKKSILSGPQGGSGEVHVKIRAVEEHKAAMENWFSLISSHNTSAKNEKDTIDKLLLYFAASSALFIRPMKTGSLLDLGIARLDDTSMRYAYKYQILQIAMQN